MAALALTALLSAGHPLHAQDPLPPAATVVGTPGAAGADAQDGDRRGATVALRGDVALVGVPRDSLATAVVAGAVLAYARGPAGWVFEAKLTAPQPVTYQTLGASLDFDGSRAVAGAPGIEGAAPAVHVFARDAGTWTHEAAIAPPTVPGARVLQFGRAVAIDGDRLAVAGDLIPDNGTGTSVVFVFRRDTDWIHEATLAAPAIDGVETRGFGSVLALSGDDLLAATASAAAQGPGGEVFAFRRTPGSGWDAGQRIVPAGGVPVGGRFGASLDLAQGMAAISAPVASAQFVFTHTPSGWTQQARIEQVGSVVALAPPRLFVANAGATETVWFEMQGGTWSPGGSVPEPPASIGFGRALAADGDRVLAGDPDAEAFPGARSGQASVLRVTGATAALEARFADAAAPGDQAGSAVAIDGDTALVAAPGAGAPQAAGRVRWLERRGGDWRERPAIAPPGGGALRLFGSAVALRGTQALVGATGLSAQGTSIGNQAFLFRREADAWALESTLSAPPGEGIARFGAAVALAPGVAFVGSPDRDGESTPRNGAVHVYGATSGGWVLTQTLRPPEGAFQQFGTAIAVQGDLLLVGAPMAPGSPTGGYVGIFVRSGGQWSPQGTITSGRSGDRFGTAIGIDAEAAWIGAPGGADPAVYRYPREAGGFGAAQVFDAPDLARDGQFGAAIAGDRERVFVGAPGEGSTLPAARFIGAVYRIRRNDGTWQLDGRWDGATLSPSTEQFGASIAADALAFLVGAPLSGGSLPYGNPGEGAAAIYEDGGLLMRDGFEP